MNKVVGFAISDEAVKQARQTHEPCYNDDCPFWDAEGCNKPDKLCWLYDSRPIHEILPELLN